MTKMNIHFSLDSDNFINLCDVAGCGIGYWASEAELHDDLYVIKEQETDEVYYLSKKKLEDTILKAYTGHYKLNKNHMQSVCSIVVENNAGEIDVECIDVLIQYALFEELVYG